MTHQIIYQIKCVAAGGSSWGGVGVGGVRPPDSPSHDLHFTFSLDGETPFIDPPPPTLPPLQNLQLCCTWGGRGFSDGRRRVPGDAAPLFLETTTVWRRRSSVPNISTYLRVRRAVLVPTERSEDIFLDSRSPFATHKF